MIYFAQSIDGGAVKIGTTRNLDTRLKQLEAHYGEPLAILATMPGGRKEEAEIHARFDHLRFGRTEQFRPAADLMAFLGKPLLVGPNPDAVEAMDFSSSRRLSVQASEAWIAWVEDGADYCRTDVSKLVDVALATYLRSQGFAKAPPRRVP